MVDATKPCPLLCTVKEAAFYLRRTPRHVRALIRDGKLPLVQETENAKWRIDISDIKELISRSKRIL